MEQLFPILVVALIVFLFAVGAYFSAKRRKELQQWAEAHGLRFSRAKDYALNARFPEFKCFWQGKNRYAYNCMTGRWSDRPIEAFDFHYQTESSDSKGRRQKHNHHFSAVIVQSAVPLKPLFIRAEGFFDHVAEFFGKEDINFESAEFSRKFFVKADDRKWAYDVIHTRTMEFLLAQPHFTIQFGPSHVLAYRATTFRAADFNSASEVASGLLDRLPDYVVKQMEDPA